MATTQCPIPVIDWERLVRYLRKCVEADTTAKLPSVTDETWRIEPVTSEQLISGRAKSVTVSAPCRALAARMRPREELFYGWPIVVIADGGTRRVAPLFVATLDRSDPTSIALADEPALNPSLLRTGGFADNDIATATDLIPETWPIGEEVSTLANRVLVELGFDAPNLDADALSPGWAPTLGVHNAAMITRGDPSDYSAGLLNELIELESRKDYAGTAAGWLAGCSIPEPRAPGPSPTASPLAASDAQEESAHQIRGSSLTVVTGPPGTGKSQLLVAAVSNAILDGESVLVASHNNAAVDVAVERCGKIEPGMLVRTGNKPARDALSQQVGVLLSNSAGADANAIAIARQRLAVAAQHRRSLHAQVDARAALDAELLAVSEEQERLADLLWPAPAARPDPQAGRETAAEAERLRSAWWFRRRRQRRLIRRLKVAGGATFDDLSAWAATVLRIPAARAQRDMISTSLGDDASALRLADSAWNEASAQAVQATCRDHILRRKGLVTALATARGGGGSWVNLMTNALVGLRGVACTNLSAKYNFPLRAGLFDLVIIDEASQCSLADALPLLYRAKRVAILGDPNQLNPIVRMTRHQANQIAHAQGLVPAELEGRGLAHSTGSAFLAYEQLVGGDKVRLLDEHYRCHPFIARWFNSAFYEGKLAILTDVSGMNTEPRGLHWIDVDRGTTQKGPDGRSLINRVEAEQVVAAMRPLIDRGLSIGVVSPFAAQADLIGQLAMGAFGAEALGMCDFAAATAHKFQGSERDVMFLASTVAMNSSTRTARWVEATKNLLNVAASRGRRALFVFGDPNAARVLGVATLASIRDFAVNERTTPAPEWLLHSDAEKRLHDAMHGAGLRPVLKPSVEGYELDFALRTADGKLLDIEVDGPHHEIRGRQRRRDVARDRLLESLGYAVIRVPAWRCYREAAVVASEIARDTNTP
jgi:very-short-patch-repair endonuclease